MIPANEPLPAIAILKNGDGGEALWCLPGSDGDAEIFSALAPSLPWNVSVFGIALTNMHKKTARVSVQQLASECRRAIDSRHLPGPVHLLGYSFGGLLAYEVAVQLTKSGHEVGFLGMVDTGLLTQLGRITAREATAAKLRRKAHTWLHHARTMIIGPHRVRWFRETVVSKLFSKSYAYLSARRRRIPSWLRNVNDLNIFASLHYQPLPYSGQVVLIRALDETRDSRWTRDLGWASVDLGDLEIRDLPGTHRDLLRTEAAGLGAVIGEYLMKYCPTQRANGDTRS